MGEKMTPCAECGMPCEPGEYHPYAACLMFKGCYNSTTVRANLTQPAQAVDVVAVREVLAEMERCLGDVPGWRSTIDKLTRALGNAQAEAPIARPLSEYHEDHGFVVWFTWDAERGDWLGEPSYIGSPTCDDWPGYHTHYLPHPTFPTPPQPEE